MVLTLASSLLLILSFPKFSFWPLAWFSFVPLFYTLRREKTFGEAFLHSYLFGFFFFLVSVEWLRHVAYIGWIFVATVYPLFFGFFGLAVHWLWRRNHFFLSLFILPSLWCVLEWTRAEMPVWGFGWNLLAYTQSFNLTIASIASFIGAYGLSWIILFANLAIFFILDFEFSHKKSEGIIALVGILALTVIFGVYFSYDFLKNEKLQNQMGTIQIAVIQGNIPQSQKWDPAYKNKILDIYEKLTYLAGGQDRKPDLIIWPEAAYPGFFNVDPENQRVSRLAQVLKIPILLGGLHLDRSDPKIERYYNSAYFIDPIENKENRYDKIRLVSFGEYVPWRKFFNFFGLERLAYSLGVSDFEPGSEMKVFSLKSNVIASEAKQSHSFEIASLALRPPRNDGLLKEEKFSVLICFEDMFPYLARDAVHKGAEFLIVITNDAWFGKSAAPDQHLEGSIFRALENDVPVIRSANTGISAIITREGKILDWVKDKSGHDTFIAGGLSGAVSVGSGNTFYQKWGYQIPFFCLIFILAGFILALVKPISDPKEYD